MKPDLRFVFLVDRDKHSLMIRRDFAAPRQRVWDCYTRSELLDRWFAPSPMTTETRSMDFREGGHWHYAMVDPGGQKFWGRMNYEQIWPIDRYVGVDGFCDESGAWNTDLPQARWDVTFHELEARRSMVETRVTFAAAHELETVLQMGMEAGLASTLERLDALLLALE